MEYKGKTVVILGLGQYEHGSGYAAVCFFLRQGANLIITDLKTEADLAHQVERVKLYARKIEYSGHIEWKLGGHDEADILKADLVVPNPGVPVTSSYVQLALKSGIAVETEMTLFFTLSPAKIIGITGTRGKSTTTALIAHLLKAYPQKVWLGGNIAKQSPLEFLEGLNEDDRVVLELSNFMLEYLDLKQQSPDIAVLLNVYPDHLNRYNGDMQVYAGVKEIITKYQTPEQVLITNHANTYTKEIGERSKARVCWYDRSGELEGYFLRGSKVVERLGGAERELVDVNQVPLRGEHNFDNILAAVAAVRQVEDDIKPLQEQIGSFASLEGRLQFIDEIKGRTFINDTTSTTPVALNAGLKAMQGRPIVLIAGGSDKGLDFSDASGELARVRAIVWLPGEGTERMKNIISEKVEQVDVANMKDAVKQAFLVAEPGTVILLSPGCASFGLFRNEFDRGDQFNNAVQELKSMM